MVNSDEVIGNKNDEEELVENTVTIEKQDEITTTNASIENYFTESKLTRDKMYSQMLETYQKILESPNVSETQKQIASQEISIINNKKNAIMISENLIKNKGIEEVIIFINNESINAIVKSNNLTEEQIAQIQNIIARELNAEIDNIHISAKN